MYRNQRTKPGIFALIFSLKKQLNILIGPACWGASGTSHLGAEVTGMDATPDSFAWVIEIQPDAVIAGSSSSGLSLQPPNLSSLTVPSWDFTEHRDPIKTKVPLTGTAQKQQSESNLLGTFSVVWKLSPTSSSEG